MAEPVPTPPIFIQNKLERIEQELREELERFLNLLHHLLEQPELSKDPLFLRRMTASVFALHGIADRAQNYDDEAIQNARWILNSMLLGPLYVKRAPKNISLLDATRHFDMQSPRASDLAKVVAAFYEYTEATNRLIEELAFTIQELIKP